MNMKKSGLFLAVVLLCGSALADVYSDAAAWWRFDKDFNEDGVAQANEIRDVRYWGSTNAAGRVYRRAGFEPDVGIAQAYRRPPLA